MWDENFAQHVYSLIGQDVEVTTTAGTFCGTLVSAGSDSLVLQTRFRGRIIRRIIRFALIVSLFRLFIGPRGIF